MDVLEDSTPQCCKHMRQQLLEAVLRQLQVLTKPYTPIIEGISLPMPLDFVFVEAFKNHLQALYCAEIGSEVAGEYF